jgi:hypothetical protein
VPALGGGAPVPQSLSNAVWQLTEQVVCPILFFGMDVKFPAKQAGIDESRIIVAALSFISTPLLKDLYAPLKS